MRRVPTLSGVLCALLLAGCASGPVAPAWQGQAQAAAEPLSAAHRENPEKLSGRRNGSAQDARFVSTAWHSHWRTTSVSVSGVG